jgi:hypothetical protein
VAVLYYASARLGQLLAIPPGNVTIVWPPSGLALAAVLLFGLVLVGVLANGVVCGVLSTLYGRYEARVVWALPLAACALALVASPLRHTVSERALQPARA